jgi:hypothetical protein
VDKLGMMHPYSTNSEERFRVPFVLALIAILLAWFISALLKKIQIQTPFWLEVPGPFALYGLLLAAFRSYLWRWRIFRALGIVKVPDLEGEWHGHGMSSFDTADQYSVRVRIRQNWTHLAIHLEADGSRSHSVVASLYVGSDETALNYLYQNEPNVHATPTMHAHNGTAKMRLAENDGRIDGEYYSGRDRGNYGSIVLRRRQRR